MKLLPSTLTGNKGVEIISALIKSFCNLGGFFMQLDVADAALLREAQKDPEKYKTLYFAHNANWRVGVQQGNNVQNKVDN